MPVCFFPLVTMEKSFTLLSKAYSSMYGLVPPPYSRTFYHLAPFFWLISFLPFLEQSHQHKKNAATSLILKEKRKSFFQHHGPYQLLPPVFALFSAKLVEGVAYTHYLCLVLFLFSLKPNPVWFFSFSTTPKLPLSRSHMTSSLLNPMVNFQSFSF